MRKLYWYISSYIRKHGWVFLVSIVLAILFFSFLLPSFSKFLTFKKRNYIAIVGQYSLSNLPEPIKNQLSAGLTTISSDLQAEPLLAERWVIEDDQKQYRFVLKKGILWQDGTELVPEDIKYNFLDVETISTPNDVIFVLPEAFAPFAVSVSEPIFKTSWESKAFGRKKFNIVGIGQYKMVNYKLQGNYLKEFIIDGPDNRYVYRFYLTETEAARAFKKGEVDVLLNLASCYGLCDWSNLEIAKDLAYNRYLAVFFNNANPKLSKNVRQALSYALDKNYGDARAIGPINPKSWAYLEGGKDYAKDWDRAVERLIDEMPREPLHFEMVTTSNFADEAERIKQSWKDFSAFAKEKCQESSDVDDKELCNNLDIDVNIKVSNFPDTANFELLLLGQEIPIDPDQYVMWHSSQATNFTNYKNTRIDSLLEKGRQTTEIAERRTIYQEFQQYLLEDPPAIFLKYLDNISIAR
jgi:peptide/nickel transport system substrate-binding protein